jgi:hypothetical protein
MRVRAFTDDDDHVKRETFPSTEEQSDMLELPLEIGVETPRHFVTLTD